MERHIFRQKNTPLVILNDGSQAKAKTGLIDVRMTNWYDLTPLGATGIFWDPERRTSNRCIFSCRLVTWNSLIWYHIPIGPWSKWKKHQGHGGVPPWSPKKSFVWMNLHVQMMLIPFERSSHMVFLVIQKEQHVWSGNWISKSSSAFHEFMRDIAWYRFRLFERACMSRSRAIKKKLANGAPPEYACSPVLPDYV